MKRFSLTLFAAAIIVSFAANARTFTEDSLTSFTGLNNSSAAWGDYKII
jgi:hypothetical protein